MFRCPGQADVAGGTPLLSVQPPRSASQRNAMVPLLPLPIVWELKTKRNQNRTENGKQKVIKTHFIHRKWNER